MLQPLLYAGALALLGREIIRNTGRLWLGVTIVGACMIVPQLNAFHGTILSESLFLSALVVVLALCVWFAHHPSWHLMVPIATVVGIAATLRRTGVALLPVLVIMALLQARRLKGSQPALFVVAALAPFFFVLAIEQAVAPFAHGGASSSVIGRHLFAKAALLDAPAAAPSADLLRATLDDHLETRYAQVRELLARAPAEVRGVLTPYYETCLQGPCADQSRALMATWPEAQQTAAMGDAGWARMVSSPLAYARLTALHLRSLWTVDRRRHPDTVAALAAFLAANRPLPFEREALQLEPGQVMDLPVSTRVRYLQPVLSSIGFFTAALALLGVMAALARVAMPPILATACTAALAGHASLLFTAMLAVGFSRFTLGVWPAIVVASAAGLWWLGAAAAPYWADRFGRPLRNTNF